LQAVFNAKTSLATATVAVKIIHGTNYFNVGQLKILKKHVLPVTITLLHHIHFDHYDENLHKRHKEAYQKKKKKKNKKKTNKQTKQV